MDDVITWEESVATPITASILDAARVGDRVELLVA
jgi:hypothetical protein